VKAAGNPRAKNPCGGIVRVGHAVYHASARLRDGDATKSEAVMRYGRMGRILWVPLMALALGGWVSKEDAFKGLPLGKKVSNPFSIGEVQVPLPEGEWVVAGRAVYAAKQTGAGTGGPGMAHIALFDVQNGILRRQVWVRTSLETGVSRWVKPKDCDRKNVFHIQSEELPQVHSQFCWVINHHRMHFDPKGEGATLEASQYLRDNGIKFPNTMLTTTFYMSVGPKYFEARYYLNPEAEGISPSKNTSWDEND
jgi:hypothetical protein